VEIKETVPVGEISQTNILTVEEYRIVQICRIILGLRKVLREKLLRQRSFKKGQGKSC